MFERIKLKRGDVLVVKTANSLPEDVLNKVAEQFQTVFPNNKVFFPNGAEIMILEPERPMVVPSEE